MKNQQYIEGDKVIVLNNYLGTVTEVNMELVEPYFVESDGAVEGDGYWYGDHELEPLFN